MTAAKVEIDSATLGQPKEHFHPAEFGAAKYSRKFAGNREIE